MPSPIVPATPANDAAGTPYSPEYGDIYHSADSGPGQARHVFLGGNDLPTRWAGARVFTIVETGFGLGLNFLATWAAWRADPARPQRLHFALLGDRPLKPFELGVNPDARKRFVGSRHYIPLIYAARLLRYGFGL